MRALKTEAAAPGVRSRNGGEIGKALAGTSSLQRYRTNRFPSMPSPERSDKIALVVSRGDRLYLVGAYAEGGAA